MQRARVSPRTFFLIVSYAVLVTAASLVHVVLHYLPPKQTVSVASADGPLDVVRHPDGTASIELTKEQTAGCDANRGCSLFPNDALLKKLDEMCSEPEDKGHFDGSIFRKGDSRGSV